MPISITGAVKYLDDRMLLRLSIAPKPVKSDTRIAELRAEIENLVGAIANGALRSSKALAARLAAAEESELERLSAQQAARSKVTKTPAGRIGERFRRMVASLDTELGRDVHAARTVLRGIIGDAIPVVPHESGKHLVARIGLDTQSLAAAAGSEIFVVAGACSGLIQ